MESKDEDTKKGDPGTYRILSPGAWGLEMGPVKLLGARQSTFCGLLTESTRLRACCAALEL